MRKPFAGGVATLGKSTGGRVMTHPPRQTAELYAVYSSASGCQLRESREAGRRVPRALRHVGGTTYTNRMSTPLGNLRRNRLLFLLGAALLAVSGVACEKGTAPAGAAGRARALPGRVGGTGGPGEDRAGAGGMVCGIGMQ